MQERTEKRRKLIELMVVSAIIGLWRTLGITRHVSGFNRHQIGRLGK